MDNLLSVDDFGSGINDLDRVEIISPDIVKLDTLPVRPDTGKSMWG